MRGSACPSADGLSNRRQVQTHHAILEKTDTVFVKQPCRHSPECCEQKGSYPVRWFSAEAGVEICPDGHVKQAVGAKPAPQLIDEVFLDSNNLACRTMAHERDFSAMLR